MNKGSRFFAALILIAAVFIMPPVNVWAQGSNDVPSPPPCTPDCGNVGWGPVKTTGMQISVCGYPCNVTVYYHTRSGICNSTGKKINEYQITQVELEAECPQQCQPDQYLNQVVLQMNLFNIPNFDLPALPGCADDRRASMSACQFVWRSRFGKNYVIKCANSPECCVANYRICYDAAGGVTGMNTIQPFMTPPNPCPDQGVVIGGVVPCKPSCNALKDLIDPYYGKSPVFTNDPAEGGATVTPNPAKGQTVIASPEMPEGGALLMVYNTRGGAVLNQRQDNREGSRYSFPIAVDNLSSGVYYYVIRGDKGGFVAGSITVAK